MRNKKDVQSRVLQKGKKLALNKFSWGEKTKTFSSEENDLVIDFAGIDNCTFKTGYGCTFKTGYGCTFKTGFGCTFTTGSGCTFTTGFGCTFTTGFGCTFTTGSDCTFKTGSGCTFKTGWCCTFTTGSDCTFKTSSGCTFKTGSDCTFKTGPNCVIVRKDIYEIIQPNLDVLLTICPYNIKGYVENNIYSETNKPAIIADGILSEIVSKKEINDVIIYKVKNHNDANVSYLIESNGVYSHGLTIKEAKESLKYKISDRDTTQYEHLTLKSLLTQEEAIKLYRVITGACESGTRYFVENLNDKPDHLTVKELIKLTGGQYNHSLLVEFFDK
jgi:hypothetical protein